MTRTPASYFEGQYQAHTDPWGFATRPYERRKYDITLACLPDDRYRSAFEPGCSIGVLTVRLAARCDRLVAMEESGAAVEEARRRLRPLRHVELRQGTVPEAWPDGPFDLLVLSELCYYFDAGELEALCQRGAASLHADATIVGVHWSGTTDYPLTAAQAHDIMGATPSWRRVIHHSDEEFLLDVWRQRA